MTQPRGQLDTAAPRPSGLGRRSAVNRAFALALVVALLLHVPFVPSHLGDWLRLALLGDTLGDYDAPDAQAIIPIDLDLFAQAPSTETTEPPPPAPGDTAARADKTKDGEPVVAVDAGA